MNDIERLKCRLSEQFPTASLAVDPSETPSGSWWLDAHYHDRLVTVEWKPLAGFGVSTSSDDAYGCGPDEVCRTESEAFERVRDLLGGT
jgi:hypothetical protein